MNNNAQQQQQQQQQPHATQGQQHPLPPLPENRQPLQITSGNANPSPGPYRPQQNAQERNTGNYNRNPFKPARPYRTRAYHADDDETPLSTDDQEQYQQYENAFYQNTTWTKEDQAPPDPSEKDFHHENKSMKTHFYSNTTTVACRICKKPFPSNNQLHKHLKSCLREATKADLQSSAAEPSADEPSGNFITIADLLIRSTAGEANATKSYGFRGYRFATIKVCFQWQGETYEICVDTGCTMSFINRKFLKQLMEAGLITEIKKMPTPMTVRDLDTNQHDASEYALVFIYLSENKGTTLITREIHIIDNLSAKTLIEIDIMKPKCMMLDLQRDVMMVGSCQHLEVPIVTHTKKGSQTDTTIFSKSRKVIAPHTDMRVSVQARRQPLQKLPTDRDFIFEPAEHDSLSVCAHVVDQSMSKVLVRNDSDRSMVLPKRTKLGKVIEYEAGGCYAVDTDLQDLARRPAKASKTSWIKKSIAAAMAVTAAFNAATTTKPEVVHSTGVTMYDSGPDSVPALTDAVEAFPSL